MVFIGTAGWSIPAQLRERFAEQGSILAKYGGVLTTVEINSTFYRRHRASTFERWRDSVPGAFRFAVKMPRAITHVAALARCQAELDAFFDDIMGLAEKLGPVLVQLPASVHFERRRARQFFVALRRRYSGLVACEPRHSSWYGAAASALFVDHDVSRVVADPPRPIQAAEPLESTSLRYVRWHGSPHIYWSAYSDEQLRSLSEWVARQPAKTAVWVIFDNTAAGGSTERRAAPDERAGGRPRLNVTRAAHATARHRRKSQAPGERRTASGRDRSA